MPVDHLGHARYSFAAVSRKYPWSLHLQKYFVLNIIQHHNYWDETICIHREKDHLPFILPFFTCTAQVSSHNFYFMSVFYFCPKETYLDFVFLLICCGNRYSGGYPYVLGKLDNFFFKSVKCSPKVKWEYIPLFKQALY